MSVTMTSVCELCEKTSKIYLIYYNKFDEDCDDYFFERLDDEEYSTKR